MANYKVFPAVVPSGFFITDGAIHTAIDALQARDANERVNAFNLLRAVPRSRIVEVWSQRQRLPMERVDCFGVVEVDLQGQTIEAERAVVYVTSPGYEDYVKLSVDSLRHFGGFVDVRVVVFAIGASYDALKDYPGVTCIKCHATGRLSTAVKGVIYSAARFINAKYILSLEADMLTVGDLSSLWATMEAGHPETLWGVRPQHASGRRYPLRQCAAHQLHIPESDLELLLGRPVDASGLFFHFNGGIIGGSQKAFRALDMTLLSMRPVAGMWVAGASPETYNEEFLLNFAANLGPVAGELAPEFNIQLYTKKVEDWLTEKETAHGYSLECLGKEAKIIHFIGDQRNLMRGYFDKFVKQGII